MNRLQQHLPAMFALAHDRTENARVELAGLLSDFFMEADAKLSMREEELLNELIDLLMQTPSPAVRMQLVEKFSDAARMPRRMAINLANGPIDAARPVLINTVALTSEDLITVITQCSHDHAEAIAHRAAVSEAVADALVLTGDIKVMQLVAENLGTTLSQKAVEILVESARFTATLREPVMKRPEMTADNANRLYWWISQELRRYAMKRFNISAGQIDESLAHTVEELLAYHQLDKNNTDVMMQVAEWLADRQAGSVRILPQVLRLGHFRLFNILLSRLSGLDLPMIDMIVEEAGGRGLAVISRALGIDKPSFVSLFLLSRGARAGDQVVHPRELSHALAAFDRLTSNLAHDLLRSWRINPSYLNHMRDELILEA